MGDSDDLSNSFLTYFVLPVAFGHSSIHYVSIFLDLHLSFFMCVRVCIFCRVIYLALILISPLWMFVCVCVGSSLYRPLDDLYYVFFREKIKRRKVFILSWLRFISWLYAAYYMWMSTIYIYLYFVLCIVVDVVFILFYSPSFDKFTSLSLPNLLFFASLLLVPCMRRFDRIIPAKM